MLIPVSPHRPAILQHDGWRVYVSIRDQAYHRELAVWKRKLREAHPDRQLTANQRIYHRRPTSRRFGRVRRAYACWQARERQWYAQFGLTPPSWTPKENTPC